MRTVLFASFVLVASSASASPITGCVTELPKQFSHDSTRHVEFNLYTDDVAGCHPSGTNARPTHGPVKFEFFDDGSERITFFAALFETCGSHQADIRDVDEHGNIVAYYDFIYDTGVNCVRGGVSSLPSTEYTQTTTTQIVTTTPVPEPATLLLITTGLGLIGLKRRRSSSAETVRISDREKMDITVTART